MGPFLGESWLMRVEGDRVVLGPLKPEFFKEYKDRVSKRRELLKLLWELCEVRGEDEIMRVLRSLLPHHGEIPAA